MSEERIAALLDEAEYAQTTWCIEYLDSLAVKWGLEEVAGGFMLDS